MKTYQTSGFLLNCTLAGLLLTGCAQQQQQGRYQPAPTPVAPAAPKPETGRNYGPTYTRFVENGVNFIRGSMAFPTGLRESSGLLIEKTVPAEVLVDQPFNYSYKVINLTDYPIHMVTLSDRFTPNLNPADANPQPSDVRDGLTTWQLGTLGPKESKVVSIRGSGKEEGAVGTCGWATYSPLLCEDIHVVKANIQLTKNAPADVLICDLIPVTLVVRNNGSSALTGVKVADSLPEGLVVDGKNGVVFEAGNLAPGESREFKFNASATRTGKFMNTAQASTAQGISADASAAIAVHEPVLTIACRAPEERFIGRPIEVCFTVANTGDAPAAGTILQVPLPTGLTFNSATAGGRVVNNNLIWDLGVVAVDAPKEVCATLVSAGGGSFQFNGVAKGDCAKQVSTSCQTRVVGISGILLEKADDPDPVEVGNTTTYTVKVTNQGTADDNNVRMVVTIAPELVPVSATGGGVIDGQTVSFPVVPRLAPKDAVSYNIIARGAKPGDGRTRFVLTSDMLKSPVLAEESTTVY